MPLRWESHPQTRRVLDSLLPHTTVPWGCLKEPDTVDHVVEKLLADPAVKIPDLSTSLVDVYHSCSLGIACVSRLCTAVLETAVHHHQLSKETLIYLQYRYGNLRAVIRGQELPQTLALSSDIYFIVSKESGALLTTHVGKYHRHQELYQYSHLDGRVTNLEKLLAVKRFSSVWVATSDPIGEIDIPF